MYTGKEENDYDNQNKDHNLGERVVLQLLESYKDDMFVLGFDNFFTSPRFLRTRISRKNGIAAIGTLRTSRQDVPCYLDLSKVRKKEKKKYALRRGNFFFELRGMFV